MAAFSYSRLNAFEQCPKKFHQVSIAKRFKEAESEAMTYGSEVHKALELRLARGKPLPLHLAHLNPLMDTLERGPGIKMTEQQMAITQDFTPTSWFGKDVYCRAIADLIITNGPNAAIFDYKTGKMSDDFTQMRLTGALYFQHDPAVQKIELAFVWIKDKKVTRETMLREHIPDVWSSLMPRVSRYQVAFDKEEFPARQGRHCRWCPVETCPFWAASR
jgi:hypothetical protein